MDDELKNAFGDEPEVSESQMQLILKTTQDTAKRRQIRANVIKGSVAVVAAGALIAGIALRSGSHEKVATDNIAAPNSVLVIDNAARVVSSVNIKDPSKKKVLFENTAGGGADFVSNAMSAQKTGQVFIQIDIGNDATNANIYSLNDDGTSNKLVEHAELLSVSPSGERLLYAADDGDARSIWTTDLASGTSIPIMRIMDPTGELIAYPRAGAFGWSDDETKISTLIQGVNTPITTTTLSDPSDTRVPTGVHGYQVSSFNTSVEHQELASGEFVAGLDSSPTDIAFINSTDFFVGNKLYKDGEATSISLPGSVSAVEATNGESSLSLGDINGASTILPSSTEKSVITHIDGDITPIEGRPGFSGPTVTNYLNTLKDGKYETEKLNADGKVVSFDYTPKVDEPTTTTSTTVDSTTSTTSVSAITTGAPATFFAAQDPGNIVEVNTGTGAVVRTVFTHSASLKLENGTRPLLISPDRKTLYTTIVECDSQSCGIPGVWKVDVDTGTPTNIRTESETVALSPDGKELAIASTDSTPKIEVLDLASNTLTMMTVRTIQNGPFVQSFSSFDRQALGTLNSGWVTFANGNSLGIDANKGLVFQAVGADAITKVSGLPTGGFGVSVDSTGTYAIVTTDTHYFVFDSSGTIKEHLVNYDAVAW